MNQCKDCVHWHKQPTNPQALNETRGQCREAPPTATTIILPQGQITACAYPLLPPNYPACSRFEERCELNGEVMMPQQRED